MDIKSSNIKHEFIIHGVEDNMVLIKTGIRYFLASKTWFRHIYPIFVEQAHDVLKEWMDDEHTDKI